MSYFQNVENVVGATELSKVEAKITLNGDKSQIILTKNERFCWKNEMKLTCFNFVVGKGLTLVTLVGRTLF